MCIRDRYNGFKSLTKSGIRNMSPKDYQDFCNAYPTLPVSENSELPVFDRHMWLSWACVRNTEILCDLVSFLDEDEYKNSGDDVKIDVYKRQEPVDMRGKMYGKQ